MQHGPSSASNGLVRTWLWERQLPHSWLREEARRNVLQHKTKCPVQVAGNGGRWRSLDSDRLRTFERLKAS